MSHLFDSPPLDKGIGRLAAGGQPEDRPKRQTDRAGRPNFVRRRHWAVLALLSAAGLIYGSLLPLHFQSHSFGDSWKLFAALWAAGLNPYYSTQDVAINVLIAVPMSFSLLGAICFRDRRWLAVLAAIALTFACCLIVSIGVEFAQLWIDGRVCSLRDIAAQVVGAGMGIVLWLSIGVVLSDRLDEFFATRRSSTRLELLLKAYVLVLVIWSILPLDLATNMGQILRKFQRGQIELVPFTFVFGSSYKLWYALVVHTALFVPVGVWAATSWLNRERLVRNLWSALAICIVLNFALEFLQLLILSRYTSATDVFCGITGSAIGILGTHWWNRRYRLDPAAGFLPSKSPAFWPVLSTAYAVVLIAVFCAPFKVVQDESQIRERLQAFADIPFRKLQTSGSDAGALFHIMRNLGWFVPLGVLAGLSVDRFSGRLRSRVFLVMAATIAIGALALAIEAGQIVMPDKTSDLTEVLIQSVGGFAGLMIAVYTTGKRRRGASAESGESFRENEFCAVSAGEPAVETIHS